MAWGKVDDKFHRHTKMRFLRGHKSGMEALGIWTYWFSWCCEDTKLDGKVPKIEMPARDLKLARVLVEAGLWEDHGGDFVFHDFHVYNPTKQQREAKKETDRERKRIALSFPRGKAPESGAEHGASIPRGNDSGNGGELGSELSRKNSGILTRDHAGAGLGNGSGPSLSPSPDHVDPPLDRAIREINAARTKRGLAPVSRMQGRDVETLLCGALEVCRDVEAAYGAYLANGDDWDARNGWPISKWAKTPMHWASPAAKGRRTGHTRAEDFAEEHANNPTGPVDLSSLRRKATPL